MLSNGGTSSWLKLLQQELTPKRNEKSEVQSGQPCNVAERILERLLKESFLQIWFNLRLPKRFLYSLLKEDSVPESNR